jgi:hypothetical protein
MVVIAATSLATAQTASGRRVAVAITRAFNGLITVNGLATTSTDGITLTNSTAATGGATVQISPRLRFRGNAWDTAASQTVDFFLENLPATAATPTGTLKFGYSLNGGAATYPLTLSSAGVLTAGGAGSSVVSGGSIQAAAGSAMFWLGRSTLTSTADKLVTIGDNAVATGTEINNGTPTLGTCTAGALTSGSHNIAGQYTSNTSGSCVINFGTPNFTNTPFCFAMSTASTTHPRISAASNSSITVTGGVSGETIQYLCVGRIGT